MAAQIGPEGLLRARRLVKGSNRPERLLGLSSHYSFASPDSDGDILGELREEDVWPAGGTDGDIGDERKKKNYFRLQPSTIQSSNNGNGIVKLTDDLRMSGLSVAFADPASRSLGLSFISSSRIIPRVGTPDVKNKSVCHQSAPVNVPDWTKILGIHHNVNSTIFTMDDDEVVEEEKERLPPHEYLAREHARSHVDARSVVEGVGRTLKGRDMSRVRNAVWTKTGFLG